MLLHIQKLTAKLQEKNGELELHKIPYIVQIFFFMKLEQLKFKNDEILSPKINFLPLNVYFITRVLLRFYKISVFMKNKLNRNILTLNLCKLMIIINKFIHSYIYQIC